MKKMLRGIVIGVAALLTVALTTSPASAVLTVLPISPSGAYTFTSPGRWSKTFLSNGLTLTCTSARLSAIISSTGVGTVPAGSFVKQGCTNAVLGAWTLTQTSAWGVRVVGELLTNPATDVLIGFDFSVPPRGWQDAGSGCTFTVSGSFTIGKLFVLPIRRAITTTDQFVVLPLPKQSLVVDSFVGATCGLLGISLGLPINVAGSFFLNRNVTVG